MWRVFFFMELMRYTKPPLTFAQQAQRLIDRGMIVSDYNLLIERLSAVSYYRLSAYWYPFKQPDETFQRGTTFEMVWRRYTFDRQLRLLVMDAVERIEVTILRTLMVEQFALQYGAFGHLAKANFSPSFPNDEYMRLLTEIEATTKRSREVFVEHFFQKYASEPHLPLWMAAEIMSFGQLLTFFRHLNYTEKKSLAHRFDLHPPVLESWLHTLNYIRNLCAHHGRLWNRELAIRPKIPEKRHLPAWHQPIRVENARIFAVLTLCRFLLEEIAPQSEWHKRLLSLIDKYPDIPLVIMGFPQRWEESTIWKNT